jgi:hypothetical protein
LKLNGVMTKENKINKFVSEHYEWLMKEVKKNIAKGKMTEYGEDLLHHILLDLYKLSDEKIDQLLNDDKMRWYVLSGCGLQLRSSTSPFYRVHRKEKMQSRENYIGGGDHEFNYSGTKGILEQEYVPYEGDPLYDCMIEEIESLHWYYRQLIQDKWIEGLTLAQMREKYGITLSSLSKDLKVAYEVIRTKCNCEL